MAFTAGFLTIPVNDKLYGLEYLPGHTTKIFAKTGVIFRLYRSPQELHNETFSGICNWLI